MNIQKLELVDVLFPFLLSGEKKNTLRWNEGEIETGFLIFYATHDPKLKSLVWVTDVQYHIMQDIAHFYNMSAEQLYASMIKHYPKIKIDSKVAYIKFLSPQETQLKYNKTKDF